VIIDFEFAFTPGRGHSLPCYSMALETGDTLFLYDELGDVTASLKRIDGTEGHAFGGPVYDPQVFMNACTRYEHENRGPVTWCHHQRDLTPGECEVAYAFAKRVGWAT
jgi:hypothetical protein